MAVVEKPNALGIATKLVERVYSKMLLVMIVYCAWGRSTGLCATSRAK